MEGITVYHGSKKALASTNLGFEVYSRSWRLLNNFIENDLRALSTSIFESVDSFIKSSHQSWLARRSCGRSALSSPEQIPTALLLAGVNTPDHYLIYQRIKSSVLSQRGSVAIIQPGSVTSSSRSLVASVIEQMTTHCVTFPTGAPFQDSEVVEQCERPDNFDDDSLKQFSSTTCKTYLALSEWYHTRANVLHSRSMLADCRKPLVLRRPRRSLSQPDTKSIGQSRPLRSNALPRSIQTATTAPLPRQRFTEQPGSRSRRREHASVPSATYPATECHSEVQSMMAEDKGPLVIILPQVESISAQVLQDFIELSSIYVSGQIGGVSRALPLCLILGLSTTPEIGFVARLNASTLGRLQMEYFTVPPPAVFLVSVLEKLIAFPGFHLTHPMWTYLVDSLFLCLDYSVRNFLRRVQFCMLEHCLNCPHPELLLPSRKARDYLVSLSSSELAHLVSVQFPSLTCCVPDSELFASPSTKHSSSSDRLLPLPLVDRLVEKLEAHWQLQCLASPVLRWLFDILSSISAFPIAKSFPDLYRLWLKNGLVDSEEFTRAKHLLSGVSKDSMLQAVSKALLTLDSFLATTHGDPAAGFYFEWPNVTFQTVQRRLMELRRSTKQWYDVLSDTDPAHVSQPSELAFIELVAAAAHPLSPSSTSVTPASGTPSTQPTRKLSIRGLRQHIRAIAAASPGHLGSPRGRHLTHWDRKRVAFINWLQSELTALIPSPMNLPLHEVFYGPRNPINRSTKLPSHPNILSVRRRLNPPYQQCLHQALSDPGNYLQISEYQLDSPDSLSSCLPDLSILYKLHLGSTKSINLYDWLVAFASVLGEDVFENSLPSKTTQFRFFHGLAQLQHIGYIKSTRRKPDFVTRLSLDLLP